MKITETVNTIERSGPMPEQSFRIKANSKAFDVLSDRLYENKVGSIIRELSSNAFDAHVEAAKELVPFEITLPTRLENTFRIRDFGLGIAPARMNDVYTVYFESTRSDSNQFVGGFGLGSKTPFSYADSFTVISRHQSIKYIYNAYRSEDGSPTLASLGQEPTNEKSGLEVYFTAKMSDFSKFEEECYTQLKFFRTKPIIVGKPDFSWADTTPLHEVPGLFRLTTSHQAGPMVLLDQVAYPLDKYTFPQQMDLLPNNMVLLFNIGDLDITASREGLSYKPLTIHAIKDHLDKVASAIGGVATQAVAKASTLWEATKLHNSYFESFGLRIKSNVTWHGKKIDKQIIYEAKKDEKLSLIHGGSRYYTKAPNRWSNETSMRPDNISEVIIVDDLTRWWDRLKLEYSSWDNYVILILPNGTPHQDIIDKLGNPPFRLLSTFPKPPSTAQGSSRVAKAKKFDLHQWGGRWSDAAVDYKKNQGTFVYLYKNHIVNEPGPTHKTIQLDMFVDSLNFLKTNCSFTDEVYGIPGTYHAQFKRAKGWANFFEYAKIKVLDFIKTNNYDLYRVNRVAYNTWTNTNEVLNNVLIEMGYTQFNSPDEPPKFPDNFSEVTSFLGINLDTKPSIDYNANFGALPKQAKELSTAITKIVKDSQIYYYDADSKIKFVFNVINSLKGKI